MRSFLDWLAELETEVVVEFPRATIRWQRLLSRKAGRESRLRHQGLRTRDERWRVERREVPPSGTRILYRAIPAA